MILLSHIISQDTPTYGNKDRFFIRDNTSIKKGDAANTSSWIFTNNHMGTHMDAPFHFCQQGKKTYEIPFNEYYFNNVTLIDVPCNNAKLIGVEDVKPFDIDNEVELLLIRTGFEQYRNEERYWSDNPGIAAELADYFRKRFTKLRCIGFDFISLTSWKFRPEGRESHKHFLCPGAEKKGIIIIEDMALNKLQQKPKWVVVAPLFTEDGNGGAVTVFAHLE